MAKSFKNQISDILKSHRGTLNSSSYYKSNGKTAGGTLATEAQMLRGFIQQGISRYYMSYEPLSERYTRTYAFKNSVESVKIKNGCAYIEFNDLAQHKSLFKHGDGYVPALINYGWRWKNSSVNIPRFSYYHGYHFLEDAIHLYLMSTDLPMEIEIHHAGNTANNKTYSKTKMPW